jgi:carbamoyltransferase
MGLAPYGEPWYRKFFDDLVRLKSDGRFELNLDYFIHHTEGVDYSFDEDGYPTVAPLYSRKLVEELGPPRARGAELTQRDKDLARSLQDCLERVYFHILNHLHAKTKVKELALAGGCALNSVANGKIFTKTPFERTWIQPAATDDGTALGAAFWVLHKVLRKPRKFVMRHAFTGPEYSEAEIRRELERFGVAHKKLERPELLRRTAERIQGGDVVGWFQGRMEWGPRALGNRSILAHPGLPKMKEVLNARIKHREWFRPFAPSILAERIGDYFVHVHPTPFMLHVYPTRAERRGELCAVNHIDNTGRVQTVSRGENALYYDLIKAVEGQTGTPVVLNTSFNENEPIVCTPKEAIDCFLRTKMDVLAVGPYFCDRKPAGTPREQPG